MGSASSKKVKQGSDGSNFILEGLFSEDQQTSRKNGSPRKLIEKKTGLDFKKACKKWNKQSGGRWPVNGTGDTSEIQEIRKILCRNTQGCCKGGPYRMDMFDRWELVIKDRNLEAITRQNEVLRANESKVKKEKDDLLLALQTAQPPDNHSKKKKKQKRLYPILYGSGTHVPEPPPYDFPGGSEEEEEVEEDPPEQKPELPIVHRGGVTTRRRAQIEAPFNPLHVKSSVSVSPTAPDPDFLPSTAFPLIQIPNPRHNPNQPTGDQNPLTISISHIWDLSELKEVVSSLVDPKRKGD
ncbi:uncharacterized protein LOC120532033 [Polypterus senegalus]|uniref:uncharacterized protein LOC120532033 n=1 Tax=Polypterus senegalus TaxID=55291 RepID=UPI0019628001|nr:uncharacterized protein LOC120532033 [Polypterus senegalus]